MKFTNKEKENCVKKDRLQKNFIIEILKERKFKYICFFWSIISIQFVIGSNLQIKGYSINSLSTFIIDILKIVLISMIFIILHYLIKELFSKIIELNKNKKIQNKEKEDKIQNKYKIVIYFLIIIICWTPAILAFYPIIFNYDGPYQIRSYIFNELHAANPLIHTMLLSIFYTFGLGILDSVSLGMFLFAIFQMVIMASIFSYTVKFIEEKTNRKWLKNIILIFFAIFPFNQLFPIMTTKDTVFAGLALLFIINIYKIIKEKSTGINIIYTIFLAVLMLLFRNNAIYALLVMILVTFFIFIKDKINYKKLMIILISIFFLYQGADKFLIYILNAETTTGQSKTTIFSQAIAKVCNEKKDELTQEEKEKISFYYKDYEKLGKTYLPNISDNAQGLIIYDKVLENRDDFYKLLISLGKKYPIIYVDSFLNTTRGYWYICDNSFNQIGHQKRPNEMGCLELTFCKTIVIGEGYNLKENSLLPQLKNLYKKAFCQNEYTKIPILYVFFQPAIYFYILLAYMLYAIYKRNKVNLIIGSYLFSYFLTFFLGPTAIIRYIYAIIVCIPVIYSLVIDEIIKEKEGK